MALDVIGAAADRLSVVTEMTERAIADDPSALLGAVAASRATGWGVAMAGGSGRRSRW